MVVYKVVNKLNGKIYVGQTVGTLKNRFKSHCSVGSGGVSALKLAIQKYGRDNFDCFVLSECASLEDLDTAEIYWIDHLQSMSPDGYNLSPGGGAFVRTQETKDKISAKAKGRPAWNKGKKLSETHKAALSAGHLGQVPSEHNKEQSRKANAGRPTWNKGMSGYTNAGSFKKGQQTTAGAFKVGGTAPNKGRKRVILNGEIRYLKRAA